MGSLVSCLVTETACCAGRAACSCLCKLCSSRSSIATRIGYALLFLLTSILSWVLLTDWAGEQLRKISYGYLDLPCPDGQCQGVLGVYRICFTNSFFVRSAGAVLLVWMRCYFHNGILIFLLHLPNSTCSLPS